MAGGRDGRVVVDDARLRRPRISVVIPTMNRCATLLEAIESVRCQDVGEPVEIVVVDNASDDATEATMRSADYADVRYLRHERRIPRVANFMFAFRAAAGDYVTILYDDEIMLQGNLRAKTEVLDQHPDVIAVLSSVTARDAATGQLTAGTVIRPSFCIEDRITFLRNSFRFTPGGLTLATMRRRAVHELSLDERDDPLDDNAFILNLSRLGKVAFLPAGYCTETTSAIGEMTRNGLMERITPRGARHLQINVPDLWFYWSHYRLRMEHVLQSDDLGRLQAIMLGREARRTLRLGVWKIVYVRLKVGTRPVRQVLSVLGRALALSPTVLIPPVFTFSRLQATTEQAEIPPFAVPARRPLGEEPTMGRTDLAAGC